MIFTLTPGSIASVLYVEDSTSPAKTICIFISHEKGVYVGKYDTPLSDVDWPIEVKAGINRHFGIVFSLPDAARDSYMRAAQPWKIQTNSN